ncbi:putative PHD finger-like domain-containing protein 5A [Glarea lozoyensis 74030]|uniref:Putative PHD finger-like domain-containing protein 5A n=1 Tax=Glarea lozoyensis (strain ATCC 74030 / MF5533) TaxID=1104152 RepID=H0EWI2_GLAL7|nr:putative PHD finger-like domain-containing protein 5A [Glarea lozoyensis 74030]
MSRHHPFGNYQNKCVVCGGEGISDAFYCFEYSKTIQNKGSFIRYHSLDFLRPDRELHTFFHFVEPNFIVSNFEPGYLENAAAI